MRHAVTVPREERRNSTPFDTLRAVTQFAVGGSVWVYNMAATICHGATTNTDAKVLKANFS